MKCDLCDNQATVFCSTIVEDKMQKVNLCKKCAEERGVMDPTSFALADLLFGLGKQESVGPAAPRGGGEVCPGCGLGAEQLRKTGRVGCARCYQVFADGLGSILRAMHKGLRHAGKVPHHYAERRARAELLGSLRDQLDAAIGEERYEDAARLRDRIAGIEAARGTPAPPDPTPQP
jgi:protein arginine kinase activator